MSAVLMPGADDRAFRTLTGQPIDPRAPWLLPPAAQRVLADRVAKAERRRFLSNPEPLTGFGSLED